MNLSPDDPRIRRLEQEIASTAARLAALRAELAELQNSRRDGPAKTTIDARSSPEAKVALFMSYFIGRPDVFATRWVSGRTGKAGWSPAVRGGYHTDGDAPQDYLPYNATVVDQHLRGRTPRGDSFHAGIYPLLIDDACSLLACDFDESKWQADAAAYAAACQERGLSPLVEISRSGRGAHVWLFFETPTPARVARLLGAELLKLAMDRRGTLSFGSYDRLFPSQDLLPTNANGRARLGNLIALPLQGESRKRGTTVFADPTTWEIHDDQFAHLASIAKVSASDLERVLSAPSRPIPAPGGVPAANVTLRLDAGVHIPLEGVGPATINSLKHAASLPNPEFYRKQAQRFSTFGTPRLVTAYELREGELRLPRGLLEVAKGLLEASGITVATSRTEPAPFTVPFSFVGHLTPEQRVATAALRRHPVGILVAAPGAGKTVMACNLIAARQVPTVVIVNRAELVDQWRASLMRFLGVQADSIGQLGAGRRRLGGLLDIVMLQTISRRGFDPDSLNGYAHVVIDECHAAAAPAALAALDKLEAPYWLGLTATPFRADHMDELITMQCGPVRHTMVAPHEARRLHVHTTSFVTREDGRSGASIQAIYGELATDPTRNQQIVADVLAAAGRGRRCLVLTNRVDHADVLNDLIKRAGADAEVLHGKLKTKERSAVMARARSSTGGGSVLVAIDKIAGEGLDLPALDTLFLTMPVSFKGKVIQLAGRITRGSGTSVPELHDYHDAEVPLLDRMYRRRRRVIERVGFVAGVT